MDARLAGRDKDSRESRRRRSSNGWALAGVVAALIASAAHADNFSRVFYDTKSGQLVVTMRYSGTNPNHNFTLSWGACQTDPNSGANTVVADVQDDQFQDAAQQPYKKTTRFNLANMPCRPASLTLRTAPRFRYTLSIPSN
jgi:hypothetical protein